MTEIAQNRGSIIDDNFRAAVQGFGATPGRIESRPLECLPSTDLWDLVRAQFRSRHLDLVARQLRRAGRGYYTVGSSGHEGNVAVAYALRPTDPAFLHYRSTAFYLERARQARHPRPARDILLGVVAARTDPIAGGRHKVFGSVDFAMPPQTSTAASHLPKAVGVARSLELRAALRPQSPSKPTLSPPDDAVIAVSFGDASLNHSTAQGALNAASYLAFQGAKVPVLFVCEDNGIGISTPTASGWVAASFAGRPTPKYFCGDGLDLLAAVEVAVEAVRYVRSTRLPAFLHLTMVRLLGHAGSDAELVYRSEAQIRADEERDPLLISARILVDRGVATAEEILEEYERARREITTAAEEVICEPGLKDAADVMWPIAPRDPAGVAAEAVRIGIASAAERLSMFDGRLPEDEGPLPLSAHLNHALTDLCLAVPELLVFGEDVARKGGVYGITRRLQRRFGDVRVFDTLLDEQSILGLAIGAGHVGLLPVAEVQYLAFLHNAEDQLRGEAATLQFFSQAQFRNPMVIRIPSYGYQKGFGGHFHNDNSIAVLRDVPGLIIASPSRGDDAAAMLRTCVAAARSAGSISVFLEPIALYGTADLEVPGDGAWLGPYRPGELAQLGRARLWNAGGGGDDQRVDLLFVTFANGVPMCLRVGRRLAAAEVCVRVLDLRWLAPLPLDDLRREACLSRAVLVVDETRATGGVSEALVAALQDMGYRGRLARVASRDSFIPLGPAADLVLLSDREIEAAARQLLNEQVGPA